MIMEAIPLTDMLLRIGLSLVLGGIIGFERERDSQPAGLRKPVWLSATAIEDAPWSIRNGTLTFDPIPDPSSARTDACVDRCAHKEFLVRIWDFA